MIERVKPDSSMELEDRVVFINRVAKVVKGGKNFKFTALVVVGDTNGGVGYGIGKAREAPDAIRKGIEKAKKNLIRVPITEKGTIPHQVQSRYCSSVIMLKPAAPGTGVIAGSSVRAVMELAGIKDILTKSLNSNNPANLVKATFKGFEMLRSVDQVAKMRGKTKKELFF